MGLLLEAIKTPSESRVFKLRVTDDDIKDGVVYSIIEREMDTFYEREVKQFSLGDEDIRVIEGLHTTTIETNVTAGKFAAKYFYRILKKLNDVVIGYTDFVYVSTSPTNVEDLDVDYENSTLDGNNLPIELCLKWNTPDIIENNFHLGSYVVYHCMSPRGRGKWSEWARIKGLSTFPMTGASTDYLPKEAKTIKIKTPQMSDNSNPYDMRFAIVSLDTNMQLQSRFSNILTLSMDGVSSGVVSSGGNLQVNHYVKGAYDLDELKVSLHFTADSFEDDTAVFISASNNAPLLRGGYKEIHAYDITANRGLKSWFTAKVHIDLFVNQKFEIRVYDEEANKWTQVAATYNQDNNYVSFTMRTISNFVLLLKNPSADKKKEYDDIVREKFSKYTTKIIKALPSWFKIRRNPVESKGAYFLEAIGLELEEMEFVLGYAYEQTHLITADVDQIDIVYKAKLPDIVTDRTDINIKTSQFVLSRAYSLEDFFRSDQLNSVRPKTFYNNTFVVDHEDNTMYVKKAYDKTKLLEYGQVKLDIFDSKKEIVSTIDLELKLHHVWNFFDEFGLLLDTPRLPEEVNAKYKERLLDVFKNESNSTRTGLVNGIAREVGIRRTAVWQDTSQDFIIRDQMVPLNLIRVNDKPFPVSLIFLTSEDHIVLKAGMQYVPPNSEVTYVTGIEMHTFHSNEDHIFDQQLYNPNGTATNLFKHYVESIKRQVPVEWGQFRWDEGFWDIADEKMSGYGFLPTILDGEFTGFRSYKGNKLKA